MQAKKPARLFCLQLIYLRGGITGKGGGGGYLTEASRMLEVFHILIRVVVTGSCVLTLSKLRS